MYKISGRVLLNGNPVQNAKVIAVSSEDKIYLNDILTDKDGYYTIILQDQKKCHVMVEYEDADGQKYNAFSKWDILPVFLTTFIDLPIDLDIVISPLNRQFDNIINLEVNTMIKQINKTILKETSPETVIATTEGPNQDQFNQQSSRPNTEYNTSTLSVNKSQQKEVTVQTEYDYTIS